MRMADGEKLKASFFKTPSAFRHPLFNEFERINKC
jgi:hypothetical protein